MNVCIFLYIVYYASDMLMYILNRYNTMIHNFISIHLNVTTGVNSGYQKKMDTRQPVGILCNKDDGGDEVIPI